VLRLPVQNKAFTVTTAASDFGIGGVLEQEFEDGSHPIAYVSRKLNVPERNYPTHDRELLAIVHVVKELRCYLHGSAFVVRTDHHPLRYLETQPHLSKRKVRWLDSLAEYDYKIEYIQGKWNIVADSLGDQMASRSRSTQGRTKLKTTQLRTSPLPHLLLLPPSQTLCLSNRRPT
jgi:RNase H-like domain found in reverse transcriptase